MVDKDNSSQNIGRFEDSKNCFTDKDKNTFDFYKGLKMEQDKT